MATRRVRFDFKTDLRNTITHVHNIPQSLIRPNAQAKQRDPAYIETFVAAIRPIMLEHEAACRAASSPNCQSCGSSTVKVLSTPMSYLHLVDEPFVNVLVNPVCDKGECEMWARREIQGIMAEVSKELDGRRRNTVEILPCKVCEETKNTKRCAQCRVVAYCGKEHQKADWKEHKGVCASLAT